MSAPLQFRKKPVVISAVQWTGENLRDVIDFTGKHHRFDEWFPSWGDYESFVRQERNVVKIITLEGTMEASPGDWIIRGVKGEHYPCKPDIFAATYEPADLAPALPSADYVAGLEAALRLIAREFEKPSKSLSDFGVSEHYKWIAYRLRKIATDARPDQPAADTRVVTVAQLERWANAAQFGTAEECEKSSYEIRAIIDGEPGK